MAHVIDVRGSEGQLVLLGGALSLPLSTVTPTGSIADGSIRYNVGSVVLEVYHGGSWHSVGEGLGLALSDLTDVQITSPTSGQIFSYNGGTSKWNNTNAPYDVYGSFIGRPTDSQNIWGIVIGRAITFPINLTGSVAVCVTAPSTDVSMPILQNGVQIGSIDWATGTTSATFTFSSAVTFASGDFLDIIAPSPLDATFLTPRWAFVGHR